MNDDTKKQTQKQKPKCKTLQRVQSNKIKTIKKTKNYSNKKLITYMKTLNEMLHTCSI